MSVSTQAQALLDESQPFSLLRDLFQGKARVLASRYFVLAQHGRAAAVVQDMLGDEELLVQALPKQRSDSHRRALERMRRFHHPNLVDVRELGRSAGNDFFTSALYPEQTLEQAAAAAGWSAVRGAVADLLAALSYLHSHGISHGDLRLANLRMDRRNRGMLVGVARCRCTSRDENSEALLHDGQQLRRSLAQLAKVTHIPKRLLSLWQLAEAETSPLHLLQCLQRSLGLEPMRQPAALPWRTVGRAPELLQLQRVLSDFLSDVPGERVVWIDGVAGIGCTQLLREIKWRAEEHCEVLEGTSQSGLAIVAHRIGVAGPKLMAQQLATGAPLIFLLDDMQEMSPQDRRDFLGFAQALQHSGRGLVICCSTQAPPRELQCRRLHLAALNHGALKDWLSTLKLTGVELERVHERSEGIPGRAESAAAECQKRNIPLYIKKPL